MKQTLHSLWNMKKEGQKIAVLTCYDASFARLMDEAGVDALLVGDSLGMVVQGETSTLPVSLDHMLYHTRAVARGSVSSFIVADLPFGSYQQSREQAFASAATLLSAGAHMVKIEGGEPMVETVRFLVDRGVPVCGHLGLTPQSVHQLGGYKLQGKDGISAARLLNEAKALEAAGAGLLVLELLPAALAAQISAALTIPTIGIGAGVDCDGQVLVTYDMLNLYPGKKARFVKDFLQQTGNIAAAIQAFVTEVKSQTYPAAEHSF